MHEQDRAGGAFGIAAAFLEHEKLHIAVFAGPMLLAADGRSGRYVIHHSPVGVRGVATGGHAGIVADLIVTAARGRREANMRDGGIRRNTISRGRIVFRSRYALSALHLFVHCAKGRGIRPAALIRLILGQIGARPSHAG